jgi:hypothetical protein
MVIDLYIFTLKRLLEEIGVQKMPNLSIKIEQITECIQNFDDFKAIVAETKKVDFSKRYHKN